MQMAAKDKNAEEEGRTGRRQELSREASEAVPQPAAAAAPEHVAAPAPAAAAAVQAVAAEDDDDAADDWEALDLDQVKEQRVGERHGGGKAGRGMCVNKDSAALT